MEDILYHAVHLASVRSTLIGYLITHTPHNYRRIIAIAANEVYDILLNPRFEVTVIAILHFSAFPLVKTLCHDHHAHLVTCLNEFRFGHVMGCTVGIASHILEHAHLTSNSRGINHCTKRSVVVMVARTLEDYTFTIEEETFIWYNIKRAYTKCCLIDISSIIPFHNLCYRLVKMRSFRTPEFRVLHHHLKVFHTSIEFCESAYPTCNYRTVGSIYIGRNAYRFRLHARRHVEFDLHIYLCKIITYYRCCYVCSPHLNRHLIGNDKMHIAIKSCTRIPARTFLIVFKTYGKGISLAYLHVRGHIKIE